jgi:motility quorum-sensing regulator/GCU-specific mRNA interferase toxin
LVRVKELIRQGSYRATRTALACAARDFGFVESGNLAECVLALEPKHFYKSMTAIHDNTLWQDVYHQPVGEMLAYVKVQILSDNTVIISFKLLEEDQ